MRRAYLALAGVCLLAAGGCRTIGSGNSDMREVSRARAPDRQWLVHRVRQGDTLPGLGREFDVEWREIARANGLSAGDELRVGNVLLVPTASGPGDAAGPGDGDFSRPRVLQQTAEGDSQGGASGNRYARPARNGFVWPVDGPVSLTFGSECRGLPEPGVAVRVPAGTAVRCVADGRVLTIVPARLAEGAAWGTVVAVQHADGLVSWYAHMGEVVVAERQTVKRGQMLGTVAGRGGRTGCQAWFRMFKDDRPVDPGSYLP